MQSPKATIDRPFPCACLSLRRLRIAYAAAALVAVFAALLYAPLWGAALALGAALAGFSALQYLIERDLRTDLSHALNRPETAEANACSAEVLEARQAQFDSVVRVLAESIDARDYLTAGHSRKVAEYAEGIAAQMGLCAEFRRMLRTAALLHDYGKIAIPDTILKKEGPLSEEERAIINTHPARSKQILEKIDLDGVYREIPDIVLSHHERWDGTGYPNALRGEQIPLASRIIAVADYYEAITAKRHYREPMRLQEALCILQGESGRHFDPRVLDAFFGYLRKAPFVRCDRGEEEAQVRVPRSAYRTEIAVKADRRIYAGFSVDISCGGLYFATCDVCDISPDTELSVTFELPQQKKLAQVCGRVAWINRGTPRPAERLPEGFGVVFHNIGDDVRSAIERYMEEPIPY